MKELDTRAIRKASTMATHLGGVQFSIGITTPASVVVKRTVDWKFTTLYLEVTVVLMMKEIS